MDSKGTSIIFADDESLFFAKLSIFISKLLLLLLQFESLEEFLLQQSSRTRNVKAAVVISSKL